MMNSFRKHLLQICCVPGTEMEADKEGTSVARTEEMLKSSHDLNCCCMYIKERIVKYVSQK
jgi:hypothetical protein